MNKKIEKRMFNSLVRSIVESNNGNKTENPYYDAKVQKAIRKIISEEIIAHDFYLGCTNAIDRDQKHIIFDKFIEIAADELNDHYIKIAKWAEQNGYDIPFKYQDYQKYASKECVKLLNGLKAKQQAIYYVEQGIKAEKDAIKSYSEIINSQDMPYDLNAIFIQNYYDEIQHLEMLNSMLMVCQAGAEPV